MSNWSDTQISSVWNKGRVVQGYDRDTWRKDKCGAWINRELHGTTGKYGWEIDHIYPKDLGGSDNINNLQPLHWKNNRSKDNSPDHPMNWCVVRANGNTNTGV